MTEIMTNLTLNKFMSDDVPDDKQASNKRPMIVGALLSICLLAACVFGADYIISKKKLQLLSEVQARQEIAVSGKIEVFQTWIEETSQRANLIANHPLFRLFAAEVNQSNGSDLSRALSEQLPYMQNAITSFVQQNKLVAAYVIGKDGRAYLASHGSPALGDQQRQVATEQYERKGITSSPLRVSGEALLLDFLIPIHSVQSDASSSDDLVVGILMMTISVSEPFSNFLKPSRLSKSGETTSLFQITKGNYHAVTPSKSPFLSDTPLMGINDNIQEFSTRNLSSEETMSYSIGSFVEGTPWALLQSAPEETALSELKEYSYGVYGLSGSVFVVVLSILSGIWLTFRSHNAKAMADQYREFARQINAQRRLLGSINNTIDDLIGLTDASGKYVYANPSLARFANFPANAVEGKTERDIFGDKASRKLNEMNQLVMDTHQSANDIIELETHAGTKIIRVEKSRLLDDDDLFIGIVTVAGDITDFIMHQRQKEELGRKTISILVHMMEDNDPYLAGHSQRMGELSNGVADIMDLPVEVKQTIATGSNLSQIGKISIPSEIRTKEGRLTDQEMTTMQGHIGKAEILLSDMEIDQPVITAVTQMYERLDGSGYPNKLGGTDIDLSARILGIADILVARVSPRSYRRAISVEEAMEVFRTNPEKYDVDVVVALDAFLISKDGKKFTEAVAEKK